MMISRSPALPVKRQPKRIDTVQLPRPPRSPSLPLIRTSLTLTEMERKKRNKRQGLFESGFFFGFVMLCVWKERVVVVGRGVGGVEGCLYDDFSFEEKEKHQSSAGFCGAF